MYRYSTHFREPGSTDTEDLNSGSRAAVAGVLLVLKCQILIPTSNIKEFQRKLDLAKNRMYCNYALFWRNSRQRKSTGRIKIYKGAGIKLFAGSSTGNLLVADEKDIDKVFQTALKLLQFTQKMKKF